MKELFSLPQEELKQYKAYMQGRNIQSSESFTPFAKNNKKILSLCGQVAEKLFDIDNPNLKHGSTFAPYLISVLFEYLRSRVYDFAHIKPFLSVEPLPQEDLEHFIFFCRKLNPDELLEQHLINRLQGAIKDKINEGYFDYLLPQIEQKKEVHDIFKGKYPDKQKPVDFTNMTAERLRDYDLERRQSGEIVVDPTVAMKEEFIKKQRKKEALERLHNKQGRTQDES